MKLYITRTTNVEPVSQVSVTVHRTGANCLNDLVCAHVQTNLLCTLFREEHAMDEELNEIHFNKEIIKMIYFTVNKDLRVEHSALHFNLCTLCTYSAQKHPC